MKKKKSHESFFPFGPLQEWCSGATLGLKTIHQEMSNKTTRRTLDRRGREAPKNNNNSPAQNNKNRSEATSAKSKREKRENKVPRSLGVVVLAHVYVRWRERRKKRVYKKEEEGGMKEMQPGETTQSTTSSTRLFSRAPARSIYTHIPPLSLSLIPLACCPKNIPGDK